MPIKKELPESSIEVLVPDLNGNTKAIKVILKSVPHIFNHNIETVPRLYSKIRSKASYENSLKVLKCAKRIKPDIVTKSGLLVGLGETEEEVFEVMKDLRKVRCDILTIGQYMQPTKYNIPVDTFVTPEQFIKYNNRAVDMGFLHVESAPFVRSSYNAELYFNRQVKQTKIGKVESGTISAYQKAAALRL